ncbi:MAG: tetratricopeptide repeat protein [Candidatus Omnitrophota bacterium]
MIWREKLPLFLVLVAVVFAVYGNTLFHQFVWDDHYLIVENPFIKSSRFLPGLFQGDVTASTTISHQSSHYYRPLSMLSFMVDYKIWCLNPFGFHLTNLIVHALNCIIIFLILCKICQDEMLSFLVSLLFAIHPIHVEAVTPIFNRMGIQVAFFMLWGFLLFIFSENCRKKSFLLSALACFILALLSKENAVVLPLLWVAYDYFFFCDQRFKRIFEKEHVQFYLCCLGIIVVYAVMRHLTLRQSFLLPVFGQENSAGFALAKNLFLHVLTVFKIAGMYVTKAIWPFPLSAVYWIDPVGGPMDPSFVINFILILLIFLAAMYFHRKDKIITFFIVFFFIGLLPYFNMIPISMAYTFRERFLYLSSLAACFIMVKVIKHVDVQFISKKAFDGVLKAVFFVFILLLAICTSVSNMIWKNNYTLWTTTVQTAPLSQLAHLNLGEVYADKGQYKKALIELAKSLHTPHPKALDSVYLARLNLAKIYTDMGQFQKALKEANQALDITKRMDLNSFAVYDKLGLIYAHLNDPQRAEQNFLESLKHQENNVSAHYNLGILYYRNKNYEKASDQLKNAYSLDQDFFQALYALGFVYLAQNRIQEAENVFQKTLLIAPDFALAKQQLIKMKATKP